jgi:hypothetical protein
MAAFPDRSGRMGNSHYLFGSVLFVAAGLNPALLTI